MRGSWPGLTGAVWLFVNLRDCGIFEKKDRGWAVWLFVNLRNGGNLKHWLVLNLRNGGNLNIGPTGSGEGDTPNFARTELGVRATAPSLLMTSNLGGISGTIGR